MPPTPTRNFRLDPQTLALLAALAQHDGVSETDVIKVAIREAARKRKVTASPP